MKKGDRIRMTAKAIKQGLQGHKNRRTGVYIGQARDRSLIRVLRDGTTVRERFHPSFWEPIE